MLAAILYAPIFVFLRLMAQKTEAMREGRQALVADAAGIELHDWRGKPIRLSWQDVDNIFVHADRLTFDGRFADGLSARVNLAELDIDGRELLRRLHQISGKPAFYRGELL